MDLILDFPDHALPIGLRTQYGLLNNGDHPLYQDLYRAETFVRDITPLMKRHGCSSPTRELTLSKDIPTIDYRSLYTPYLIDTVAQRYRQDMDAYGYANAVAELHEYVAQFRQSSRHATPPQKTAEDTRTPCKTPLRKIGIYCLREMKGLVYDAGKLLRCSPRRPFAKTKLILSEINPSLLYIMNPKCASSSIKSIIKGRILSLPTRHSPWLSPWSSLWLLFATPSLKARLSREFRESNIPFRFSFVRDPFSRLVSCYNNKIRQYQELNRWQRYCQTAGRGLGFSLYDVFNYQKWPVSFDDFVKLVACTPDHLADMHIKSQYATLYENGECLAEYIGKVENFNEDMRYLRERFDLSAYNQKRNASSVNMEDDYRNLYTLELIDLIAERYAMDIKTFGYETALTELREHARTRHPNALDNSGNPNEIKTD